jgi:hypothetical protein
VAGPTRKPVSPHGRLFGGDTLYEVLAAVARSKVPVGAVPLAEELGRTPKQTREELAKLLELGVVRIAGKSRKALLLEPDDNALANAVLMLPDLLEGRLGAYTRG